MHCNFHNYTFHVTAHFIWEVNQDIYLVMPITRKEDYLKIFKSKASRHQLEVLQSLVKVGLNNVNILEWASQSLNLNPIANLVNELCTQAKRPIKLTEVRLYSIRRNGQNFQQNIAGILLAGYPKSLTQVKQLKGKWHQILTNAFKRTDKLVQKRSAGVCLGHNIIHFVYF